MVKAISSVPFIYVSSNANKYKYKLIIDYDKKHFQRRHWDSVFVMAMNKVTPGLVSSSHLQVLGLVGQKNAEDRGNFTNTVPFLHI